MKSCTTIPQSSALTITPWAHPPWWGNQYRRRKPLSSNCCIPMNERLLVYKNINSFLSYLKGLKCCKWERQTDRQIETETKDLDSGLMKDCYHSPHVETHTRILSLTSSGSKLGRGPRPQGHAQYSFCSDCLFILTHCLSCGGWNCELI